MPDQPSQRGLMLQNSDSEAISEIAAILAKGYLRYRKSRRIQVPRDALASAPEPSRHVSVVNDQRTDEN